MTKEWAEQMLKDTLERIAKAQEHVILTLEELLKEKKIEDNMLIGFVENIKNHPNCIDETFVYHLFLKNVFDKDKDIAKFVKTHGLDKDFDTIRYYESFKYNGADYNPFDRYVDSKTIIFDGDILITDPCYLINEDNNDDWEKCEWGAKMEKLGFSKNYLVHDTIYGDWGCGVYDTTKEKFKPTEIGHFCADAGLVGVFLMDEVNKYNPSFRKEYLEDRDWCACLIKDFYGRVTIKVEKDGDNDYICYVIGEGINKKTSEVFSFRSSQTEL